MQRELKKKWIEDLRANGSKQGQGYLHFLVYRPGKVDPVDRYCCLGRLCEVAGLRWEIGGRSVFTVCTIAGTSAEVLIPRELLQRLGLSDREQRTLAWMNDRGGTFATIADWIEVHIEEED
jgi:hypothetical protein